MGRREVTILGSTVFVAAVLLIYLATLIPLSYDGLWHLFIAKQDTWAGMFNEQQLVTHPPLYFVLLRLACEFGATLLTYRAVSILAALGGVVLMWGIARKTTTHPWAPAAAAFAFAVSVPQVLVTLQLRSYMLCLFFVLWSFYYYLDVIQGAGGKVRWTTWLGFALPLLLAILSHYFAAFYLLTCVAAPFFIATINANYRSRFPKFLGANFVPGLLSLLPIFAVLAYLYFTHMQQFAKRQGYLLQFYFDWTGSESAPRFFLRTTQNLFNLLSPISISGEHDFFPVVFLLIGVTVAAVFLLHTRQSDRHMVEGMPMVFALFILGGFICASFVGVYPYGGHLRHQFLLYPFVLLAIVAVLDKLVISIRPTATVMLILSLGFFGFGLSSFLQVERLRNMTLANRDQEVDVFLAEFPNPHTVFVDQFSSIHFFGRHHNWTWQSHGRVFPQERVLRYTVRKGETQFDVILDRSWWNFDFASPRLYQTLSRVFSALGKQAVTVFHLKQCCVESSEKNEEGQSLRDQIENLSAKSGIQLSDVVSNQEYVFAELLWPGMTRKPVSVTVALSAGLIPLEDQGKSWSP